MIKVQHDEREYAYIPKRSCWVNQTNQIIRSSSKQEILRQIAVDAGHTDIEFAKPVSDMEQYIEMLDKTPVKSEVKEPKKKKNTRLKSPNAVSLMSILNQEKEKDQ